MRLFQKEHVFLNDWDAITVCSHRTVLLKKVQAFFAGLSFMNMSLVWLLGLHGAEHAEPMAFRERGTQSRSGLKWLTRLTSLPSLHIKERTA